MSEDNVIPFREKPKSEPFRVSFTSGEGVRLDSQCEGIVHYFEHVPGHCQCGEEFWNGSQSTESA